jgi:nicotinamide riboside kinase
MAGFPPRIHVLFAREADYAVVIRRGPSQYFCTIGWDRCNHSFVLGQWWKGSIDERNSDLSPDGKHMIFCARSRHGDFENAGIGTAISLTPYLKPVGLWSSKEGTWIGGGLFVGNSQYWIHHGQLGHDAILTPTTLTESKKCPFMSKYRDLYYLRLQRDGWTHIERQELNSYTSVDVFDKQADPVWTLRKNVISTIASAKPRQGKGCSYDEHQLLQNGETIEILDLPRWEWADADHRGLYWAEKGKLFTAQLSKKGLESITELYDFNPMKFDPSDAPY